MTRKKKTEEIKKERKRRLFFRKLFLLKYLFAFLCLTYGVYHVYSKFSCYVSDISNFLGLNIRSIKIEGCNLIDSDKIANNISAYSISCKSQSIFLFSLSKAYEYLKKEPWVNRVSIKRIFPDTIWIKIEERKPVALFYNKKLIHLVDKDGVNFQTTKWKSFSDLLLLQGESASEYSKDILPTIELHTKIRKIARTLVLVHKRRWNLVIGEKTLVKLPEEGIESALEKLEKIIAKIPLFNIDVIDLRIVSKTILEGDGLSENKNIYT